jgi:hypothetical protein
MANNTNPFGMLKSDIDKLGKLIANSRPSLDVNFTKRVSPGNFQCARCRKTKNHNDVARIGNHFFVLSV